MGGKIEEYKRGDSQNQDLVTLSLPFALKKAAVFIFVCNRKSIS